MVCEKCKSKILRMKKTENILIYFCDVCGEEYYKKEDEEKLPDIKNIIKNIEVKEIK